MTDDEIVQKIVMDEELFQNGVIDGKFEGCDASVPFQNWWMEQSATHQPEFVGDVCW